MKQHIIYECEHCGKQSKDREKIMECEAAHFGLTITEKQKWEWLKEKARYKGRIVSSYKNEWTDKEFDDAITELMDFEKKHGLKEK